MCKRINFTCLRLLVFLPFGALGASGVHRNRFGKAFAHGNQLLGASGRKLQ